MLWAKNNRGKMLSKDIVVLESKNKNIYGLRVRSGGLKGTEVIISETGKLENQSGWKLADVSGLLLCFRTTDRMKQVADELEKENQQWFEIRTRKNEQEVPYPYTVGIICEKSKLNELDRFLAGWKGFGSGRDYVDMDIYAGETRIKNFLEMSLIEDEISATHAPKEYYEM